jgi:hypothetical protein
VVAKGVDTLHYTAPLAVSELLQQTLERDMSAVRSGTQVIRELAGAAYEVQRSGGGGYRYRLHCKDRDVTILVGLMHNGEVRRGIKVDLGSFACWSGLRQVYEHTRDAASELMNTGGYQWEAKPTRIDLTVDFQGVVPLKSWEAGVVMRGRRRAGTEAPPDDYELKQRAYMKSRRHFEGWDWGKGNPLMVRLYDKVREIRKNSPDKVWFLTDVWPRSPEYVRQLEQDPDRPDPMLGWPIDPNRSGGFPEHGPQLPVWRLEVECKGKFLGKTELHDGRFSTVEMCLDNAQDLYRYFIGDHLRHCTRCGRRDLELDRYRKNQCMQCLADWDPRKVYVPNGKPRRPFQGPKFQPTPADYKSIYLTRKKGWIELRVPVRGEPTNRWEVHGLWRMLQEIEFDFSQPEVIDRLRRCRDLARYEIAMAQLKGALSSVASLARLGDQPFKSPEELMAEAVKLLRSEVPPEEFVALMAKKDALRDGAALRAANPTPRAVRGDQPSPVPETSARALARRNRLAQELAAFTPLPRLHRMPPPLSPDEIAALHPTLREIVAYGERMKRFKFKQAPITLDGGKRRGTARGNASDNGTAGAAGRGEETARPAGAGQAPATPPAAQQLALGVGWAPGEDDDPGGAGRRGG